MFGNLAEMAKLMSKAKDIQANLKKFKEEMPTMEFSASSAGNLVKVTVSGDFMVKGVEIAPDANLNAAELQEARSRKRSPASARTLSRQLRLL